MLVAAWVSAIDALAVTTRTAIVAMTQMRGRDCCRTAIVSSGVRSLWVNFLRSAVSDNCVSFLSG